MPRTLRSLVVLAPFALITLSAPVGASETPSDAGAAKAPGPPEAEASAQQPSSEDEVPAWPRQRWVLTGGLTVLIDNWEPGGAAAAGDVTLGGSMIGDWIRFGVGVFAGQGPATPYYCLPCGGTPIPVAPTLRLGGVQVTTELRVPLGPVQPFFGFRQGVAIASGLTDPIAPSLLLTFNPRLGVEVPLRSGWSMRMSAGFEAVTHRWVLGDALPLPGASRLSPVHNRATVGVSWAKVF